MMLGEVVGNISKIAYRPVKGMGTTEVDSAYIIPGGIVGDKEYVVVQAVPDPQGVHRWVSQREFPTLATIQTHVDDDGLYMTLPNGEMFLVPRDMKGKQVTVQVWNDVIDDNSEQGYYANQWLSDYLQHGVLLARAGNTFDRPVSSKWLKNDSKLRGYQDSYPVHWFYQESLDELNRKIRESGLGGVPWTRFRPNIIVEGAPEPDYEHLVFEGSFGQVPFLNAKPCDRCPVPLVDQDLGQRINAEPLKTLNGYKRWLKPDNKVLVIFGENALPQTEGEIAVGQEVTVVDFRNPPLVYGGAEIKPQQHSL